VGLYIGSLISARYGRRRVLYVMSAWALVCAAIIISARTKEHMIMGRILNYTYVVCATTSGHIE
jgi:MFS family permease